MPEEALLGRVVPAVPSAGHGPPQCAVLHQLDELQTGVVGPLVAVDHGLLAQRDPMVLYQQLDRFQNKIHFQRFAYRIGQDLLCELLGHEYILHGSLNGQKMCAKVNSRLEPEAHTTIKLTMDLSKVHFFDLETENRID